VTDLQLGTGRDRHCIDDWTAIDAHRDAPGQLPHHEAVGSDLDQHVMRIQRWVVAADSGTWSTADDVRPMPQHGRPPGIGAGIPCEGPEFVHHQYKARRPASVGSP
jgi:hypothetical protein